MNNRILLTFFAMLVIGETKAITYTVTNTNDSGAGSLRQAITDANASPGTDDVAFNIAGMPPHVINIGTTTTISLPQVPNSQTIIIDGSTQPLNGYTGKGPLIILDGTNVSSGSDQDGLNIFANSSEIYGLFIRNFPHHGIAMAGDYYTIGGTGSFEHNVVSGNGYEGLYIFLTSKEGLIQNNLIGLDADGITAMGNNNSGVHFWQSSNGHMVGGSGPGQSNTIAHNGRGVYVRSGQFNTISQNSIFCNTYDGIWHGSGGNLVDAPIIQTATACGASGTAFVNSVVEIFNDDSCMNCEGKTYIGSTTTNGLGEWSYLGSLSGTITATVTDTVNNTSEFSLCTAVTAGGGPSVNLGADTILCPTCSIVLDAGNPGSTFSWSTGETTQQITAMGPDTFVVTVSDGSGCFTVDSIIVGVIDDTFLTEADANTFSLSPNPSSGKVHLEFRAPTAVHGATLVDLRGKTVKSWQDLCADCLKLELNAEEIHHGLYVLILQTSERILSHRLVFQ